MIYLYEQISTHARGGKVMFYYCPKCGEIEKKVLKQDEVTLCKVCNHVLQAVPQVYLMPNGSFFKSQKDRDNFILQIQNGEEYDAEISNQKDKIKEEYAIQKQQQIQVVNEKMDAEKFKLTCPVCGSNSLKKISNLGKVAKVYALGLYGAGSLGKTWKCNVCNTKF